ncbi:MAG: hypothetical protein O7H41_21155 [Planctomycetota bacterium]|nr:hypothetical protein [Planctomycetota bacterium]
MRRGSHGIGQRMPLAVGLVMAAAVLVTASPAWAQAPVVDGFVRDPVTGVVEAPYVINGITYTQDQVSGDFAGILYEATSGGTLYFAFEQSVFINDNTYGVNAIGWPGRRGHRLKDLLNSEHMKAKMFDCNGNLVLEYFLDYATRDRVSGVIENRGVTGGDGEMILGDPAVITGSESSLVWDFNLASPTWADKDTTNPQRVPTNTYDPGATADPDAPWIYPLVYEWSVADSAFPAGFCGALTITEVHNSPFKTGNPVPIPVLRLRKTSDPVSGSVVDPGQVITFTITATNVGTSTLTSVTITDVVDDNLDNVVVLDGGVYDEGSRTAAWGPFDLLPGDSVSVSFQATVTPVDIALGDCPNGIQIFNTGVVESPDLPTPAETNTTQHCVNPAPVLTITKVVNPDVAKPGDTVSYAITVSNTGASPATNTVLTDDPDETYIASISNISNAGVYDGNIITWSLGTLNPSDVVVVTYDATLKDASTGLFLQGNTQVPNTATVDSEETEPISDDALVIVPTAANLTIDKSGTPTTTSPGGVVSYSITLGNDGDAPAFNVTLTDDPDETWVASISNISDGGSYDGNLISWNIGTLNPGDTVTRTYDATMQAAGVFPAGSTLVLNTATADSDETDPVQDDQTVTVLADVDLSLTKSSSTSVVTRTVENTGSIDSNESVPESSNTTTDMGVISATQITYVLSYSNSGNADATGVTISDTLPADTKFVSADNGGVYDANTNTVTWSIGTVGVGGNGTVTLVVETTNS